MVHFRGIKQKDNKKILFSEFDFLLDDFRSWDQRGMVHFIGIKQKDYFQSSNFCWIIFGLEINENQRINGRFLQQTSFCPIWQLHQLLCQLEWNLFSKDEIKNNQKNN